MNINEQSYITILKEKVKGRISADINENTINQIVKTNLVHSHIDDKKSADFQKYYFCTLANEELYFNSTDFFKRFKQQYSLLYIDNNFLDKLEGLKEEILNNIRSDNLTQLYFDTFKRAIIKHVNELKEKDLGSFFAKLVHTFRPNEYCALDNPIKNYFGLKKESFFLAFLIISFGYKYWAADNQKLIRSIREKFKQADRKSVIDHDKLTDLKLLDLIFWSKADREHKLQKALLETKRDLKQKKFVKESVENHIKRITAGTRRG